MTPNVFEYHLKKGYITIEGGHRIGFCGNVIVKNDEIITINQLNTISIRVSKNTTLFNKKVFIDLFTEKNPSNVCVISPPGCGKTTFLKDFVRYLSDKLNWLNICVVDERCEIINNTMKNNLSVIYGAPKVTATEMVIKCLSPDLIVFDEMYTINEFECIKKVNSSGCYAAFSVHGNDFETLCKDIIDIRKICNNNVVVVELSRKNGCGTIEKIRRI